MSGRMGSIEEMLHWSVEGVAFFIIPHSAVELGADDGG